MKHVGIAGCGSIATVHAWALEQTKGCEITAVCDIDDGQARKLLAQTKSGHAAVFDSFQEMLESGLVDTVHICTPHYLHVPMACQALEMGINVFLEKPVAISTEQLEQLRKAQQRSDARLGVCFQNRYNAATRKLDELVASKQYGKVLGGRAFVTWRRDADYYENSPWKGRFATEGGGVLMNQAIHTLDLLLRYLGMPQKVEAVMTNHHSKDAVEVEDTVEAWLEFSEGKRGCFYASNGYAADAPVLLEIQCRQARLSLTEGGVCVAQNNSTEVIPCKEPEGIGKSYWGSGHLTCIRDFYECLETGRRFENDFDGVYTTAFTTLQIYEKGRKREWNR